MKRSNWLLMQFIIPFRLSGVTRPFETNAWQKPWSNRVASDLNLTLLIFICTNTTSEWAKCKTTAQDYTIMSDKFGK